MRFGMWAVLCIREKNLTETKWTGQKEPKQRRKLDASAFPVALRCKEPNDPLLPPLSVNTASKTKRQSWVGGHTFTSGRKGSGFANGHSFVSLEIDLLVPKSSLADASWLSTLLIIFTRSCFFWSWRCSFSLIVLEYQSDDAKSRCLDRRWWRACKGQIEFVFWRRTTYIYN